MLEPDPGDIRPEYMTEEQFEHIKGVIDSRVLMLLNYYRFPYDLRHRSQALWMFYDYLYLIEEDDVRAMFKYVIEHEFGLVVLEIQKIAEMN